MIYSDIADVRMVTPPTVEPVPVALLKQHLRLGGDPEEVDEFESVVLPTYAAAAREHAEKVTGLILTDAVYELRVRGFCHCIPFPLSPVTAVQEVTYTDENGAALVLDPAVYQLDDHPWRPRLVLAYQQSWPAVREGAGAVRILFQGPFGPEGLSPPKQQVPAQILTAILLMVGHWYENREEVIVGTTAAEVPMAAKHILQLYRRNMGV